VVVQEFVVCDGVTIDYVAICVFPLTYTVPFVRTKGIACDNVAVAIIPKPYAKIVVRDSVTSDGVVA
jgi:hypothetical protein